MRAAVCGNDEDRVEAPVGEECMECEEPIADGESGVLVMVGIWVEDVGMVESYPAPVHKECMLRMTVGSLAHLNQECTCYGGNGGEYNLTRREESKLVYRRIHAGLS